MRGKYYFLLLFFTLLKSVLLGQDKEYGVWTSIGLEKDIKKWSFKAETQMRTKNNVSGIQRWSLKAEVAYKVFKPLITGIGYQFIYFNDAKYHDYQPRQRYYFYLQGKQNIGSFTIKLREQGQRTLKDERNRVKTSGEYDTYKINPEWYWRNQLKIAYNIPGFPVNPAFSVETFYQLNNPDGNKFDEVRYQLLFAYKPKKHHQLELYGLMSQEINVDDPVITYIAGLSYTYSF
jgi:hypothetical protein